MNNDYWLTPEWPAATNIHAATTLRNGGVSSGDFNSLNIAMHVGDDPKHVLQNRLIVKQRLQLPSEPVWLQQEHGCLCINADTTTGQVLIADASFSNQSGVVCAVMTADCLPILMCTKNGSQIAAIHAGWRGLAAGIITNTVNSFASNDILAWMGPAIGPECFEVGNDVQNRFLAKSNAYAQAFTHLAEDKWLANIYQLAQIELNALGVNEVYGGGLCTMTDDQRFFSYRRNNNTGRMLSLIWRD